MYSSRPNRRTRLIGESHVCLQVYSKGRFICGDKILTGDFIADSNPRLIGHFYICLHFHAVSRISLSVLVYRIDICNFIAPHTTKNQREFSFSWFYFNVSSKLIHSNVYTFVFVKIYNTLLNIVNSRFIRSFLFCIFLRGFLHYYFSLNKTMHLDRFSMYKKFDTLFAIVGG